MARCHAFAREGGGGGQGDGALGDPAARVGGDGFASAFECLRVGLGSDDDAHAAGAVDGLHDQLVDLVEDRLQLARLVGAVRLHVGENRFLGEVVADEVGDVGVEELVVRDPVAHRVRECDVPGLGGVHDARAADHRVGAEVQRVEEVVVEPPVYDVDGHLAACGPHPHPVVAADQVVPHHQLHAHQPGEQGVFEVGGVPRSRGEDHDSGVLRPGGRGGPQRGQQPPRVPVDGDHVLLGEEGREDPRHGPAVLDDVRNPAGDPHVVLEDPEVAGLVPYEVDAGDVDAYSARWLDPLRGPMEMSRVEEQPPGHHTVLEGTAVRVGVGEIGLQGPHPLRHPALDEIPLQRVDDPGHQVQWPGPFLAREGVGHAAVGERAGHLVRAEAQFTRLDGLECRQYRLIGGSDLTRPHKHLVPRIGQCVCVKYVRHEGTLEAIRNTAISE